MLWANRGGGVVFGRLRATDQWKVHSFYRPDDKLSPGEFTVHLKQVKLELAC